MAETQRTGTNHEIGIISPIDGVRGIAGIDNIEVDPGVRRRVLEVQHNRTLPLHEGIGGDAIIGRGIGEASASGVERVGASVGRIVVIDCANGDRSGIESCRRAATVHDRDRNGFYRTGTGIAVVGNAKAAIVVDGQRRIEACAFGEYTPVQIEIQRANRVTMKVEGRHTGIGG